MSAALAFHNGSVPLVPAALHNFRPSSQEVKEQQFAIHKNQFLGTGPLKKVHSKQDTECKFTLNRLDIHLCIGDKEKYRENSKVGFLRERNILNEVESHQVKRLKKLIGL